MLFLCYIFWKWFISTLMRTDQMVHRIASRIRMEDAEQASHIFSLLMGDDVPPRKAFIVENADDFDRSKIDT